MELDFPPKLGDARRARLAEVADALDRMHGAELLGLALYGSAGRETDTVHSDLDVMIVLTEAAAEHPGLDALAAPDLDLIPMTLGRLEHLATFEDEDWGYRWSYAWIPTLLDRTGGRLPTAIARHERLSPEESSGILLEHGRLDAWINLVYRTLKSVRDGRAVEARLDAAESIPMFLDVVFSLEGRVRPYNSYLLWSLEHHPLRTWDAEDLLHRIDRMHHADPAAFVDALAMIRDRCTRIPAPATRNATLELIDSWTPDHYPVLHGL